MKKIKLTQDKIALVDDDDFDELNKHKWCAFKYGKVWRAFRGIHRNKKYSVEYMSRVVLPCPPGMQVDHINGDGLDNRRCNLRIVTVSQNQHNVGVCARNTSGFRGVSKHRNKWTAFIIIQGKQHNIGHFDTPEEASEARNKYAREQLGEFSGVDRL